MSFRLPPRALLAHRGASANAPENTLDAFRLAAEQGADGIEVDVQLTADRRLVVVHDRALDRLAGVKVQVEHSSFDELRGYNIAAHARSTARMPTLEELFDAVPRELPLNLELKHWDAPREAYVDAVKRAIAVRGNVLVSSFDHELLRLARHAMPALPLAPLFHAEADELVEAEMIERIAAVVALEAYSLHINHEAATPRIVSAVAGHGLPLLVYTVDDPAIGAALLARGIAGLFTNRPAAMRAALG
jgi:glycerophosphoryl diester phosphodiesterase